MSDKKIGVITEQGYPIQGANLGFKPLSESERKALEEKLDKDKNK